MNSKIKLHFLGASHTVTGSKFLIETNQSNILIDCGMFQGLKELRLLNWKPFPFPAKDIDFVVLTHAHLDHCGYLPKLIQQGFKGSVYGTAPTLAIAEVILRDSAVIQEEEAKKANDEGYSSHQPALPFYTLKEAEQTIKHFKTQKINEWITLTESIRYRHQKNGHIIGATFIELEVNEKIIVRKNDLLLDPPNKPKWADILVMESTYGNKLHPENDVDILLTESIKQCIHNKSTLIIPSFAVERLQTLMYKLWELYSKNKIPQIPIFIDSPMGNEVIDIFSQFPEWHKLSGKEFNALKKHFNIITSYKDTWETIDDQRAKVVIAGSGMVTGGRVLTYLRYYLDKPETIVLLAGFQAEGTRGRQLQEGAHELKLHGKYIPVKAQIKSIQSLSAHADQSELIDWMNDIKNIPEQVFLVHGEPTALDALRVKINDTYGYKTSIPMLNDVFEID
ncbi:MBL fold metallo-hydrolase [uncultured Planktosalinus sp.]|uniref:MBL fold metallo-hydrolase n=1 Tax=uncultured Planktosalinus sp. TaxID=1810935 RepID=UPI0030D8CC7F